MKSIKQQEAIITGATPGPWRVDIDIDSDGISKPEPIQCAVHGLNRSFWCETWADKNEWRQSCANAEFVAASRTEWPELLAWAKRARTMVELVKFNLSYSVCNECDECSLCEARKLLEELPE